VVCMYVNTICNLFFSMFIFLNFYSFIQNTHEDCLQDEAQKSRV
jgi:hypothetical protein